MSMSGDPTSSSTSYGNGGVVTGQDMGIGDTNIHMQNPGVMNAHDMNPGAAHFTDQLGDISKQIGASTPGSDYYNHMMGTQQQNLMSGMGNQYASMGLAGSSAEMGGMNQAMQQNQMAWIGKQQSDALRAAQAQSGLAQAGYGETMGIQNQYGNFQDAANQNKLGLLGLQQQQKQGNQQFWGGIAGAGIGAVGQGAGMAAMAM